MKLPFRLATFLLIFLAAAAQAELKLGSPFTDHMMVQHDKPLVVWGWDEPGQEVKVQFHDETAKAMAAEDGRWETEIPAPDAGGPYEIAIAGSSSITLKDVLSGEVWLASGQSNMGWPVKKSADAQAVIAAANDPQMRFFHVPLVSEEEPQETVEAKWELVSPQSVPDFSGVAYFFAKRLREELDAPVGIIQSAWGGSKIQAWIPKDIMSRQPDYAELTADYEKRVKDWERRKAEWEQGGKKGKRPIPQGGGPQHGVSFLDNAMIRPIQPYPIKGAIWYQGESDSWQGERYRELFALLVNSWRERFRDPDLPVYFAQLPNFKNNWANFRYHQSLIPTELPHTDYAVLIDAGEVDDIHPADKKTPGHRLAQLALAKTYGKDIVPGGPYPREPGKPVQAGGSMIKVRFENAGSGIEIRPTEKNSPFVMFFKDGSKQSVVPEVKDADTLIFTVPEGKEAERIVYANFANPPAVLYNKEGFPGTPFRLDIAD